MSSPRSNNAITASVEEKIRMRAYQLYEKRGGQHGHALEDWLKAEVETLQSKIGIVPTPAAVSTPTTAPTPNTSFKTTRPRRNSN